jgi:hypothetical protein
VDVLPLREADRERARAWLRAHWAESMAANGERFKPAEHDGFVARDREGLITETQPGHQPPISDEIELTAAL